ncbi:hypothetical protein Btru_020269 [Bulinus truncatus]|nr:hypothetical protein Btru_020269 [Bulinus truncatus]
MEILYMKDLSTCLIESLTQLLETRPRDPIEYLALSLKHYRRLHPLNSQGRQQHGMKTISHKASVFSPSQTPLSETDIVAPVGNISSEIDIDNENKRTGKDLILLDNDDIFVHKDFLQQVTLDDLFDDEDLL